MYIYMMHCARMRASYACVEIRTILQYMLYMYMIYAMHAHDLCYICT